ncbi:Flp pilus assembly protein TadB [Rhodovastum atsumiense]|uniref:Type II secretion system protein F n=1 Tax=Rhodovastum atsumiense TaxID=504468 RepID=A0A5M6IZY0_9PROT|nr:type II secretion system F family protein [Rhodovastum atsumiense]KAA5613892.1 type II secretion system protein F [Rhodovastum atsumiense]CAH2602018.1 Flp pilus assembly protein TadB [Rhodovastum atsumiense]
MTPPLSSAVLLAGSAVALLASAVCLVRADRRERMRKRRLAEVAQAWRPTAAARTPLLATPGRRPATSGAAARALALLQIDTGRPDLYPTRWWIVATVVVAVAVLACGAGAFLLGPACWLALPLAWAGLTRLVFGGYRRRRSALLYAQLPDALAMIVRSVRAGIPVPEALRVVGEEGQFPTSSEFRRLADEIRLGSALAEALVRLAQRSQLVEYRFFAVALALQSQSGGNLAETLENLADVVRKRVALRQRAIALSSEARLTMWVLAALPFITAGALLMVAHDYFLVLFVTTTGKFILATGICFLALGVGSMQFIIRRSLS